MNKFAIFAAVAVAVGTPAFAQGKIGTVERGAWKCELPGTAAGRAGVRQEDQDFTILSASRYSARDGRGSYLRRGDTMTMTSGSRNGAAYRVISENFMRKLDKDGKPTALRCIRNRES